MSARTEPPFRADRAGGRARGVTVPRAPTRQQLVILGALSTFGPLSLDMYLPGLPALAREFGASPAVAQLTITACMVGLGIGQLVAGPLSDLHGRRGPLLVGLVGYIVASFACAFAPSIATLVVLRLIQGMVGGAGVVIARAIVRDLCDGPVAARVFALLMAITGVAPVCAPLIGGQALAFTSWRGIFVILAVIGVPLLIGAAVGLPETLPAHRRHGGGLRATVHTFGRLLMDRSFSPHALSFALSFAAMFAYIAGSSFVLEDLYGVSPQLFGVVFAINSAALVAAAQLGGRVVGRVGSDRLLLWGLFGTAASSVATLVVTLLHAPLAWLLLSFFMLLASNGIVLPNGTATALAEQQESLGSASALLGLGQFGFGALVAPLVGLAGTGSALPMAIVIATAGSAAIAVQLAFAQRPVNQRPVARV